VKSKSIKGKSAEEIRLELEDNMADGFRPTLAIVFVSVSLDRSAIVKILDDEAIDIFGVTTNGEFTDETPEKGSAAILLLDIDRDFFQIYFEEYPDKNYREVAKGIAQRASKKFSPPAFAWPRRGSWR
jgi:hypothetical protein